MKDHDWKLVLTYLRAGPTEFTWRCASCRTEVKTLAPGHVGSEGARHYEPGRQALQHNAVLDDCDEALVDGVHDL